MVRTHPKKTPDAVLGSMTLPPTPRSPWVPVVKRALDLLVGLVGSLLFVVSYPLLAILVRCDSPGPILYRQPRIGVNRRAGTAATNHPRRRKNLGGKPFIICKYRTMCQHAEKSGPQLWNQGDARVTRVGRFLRATHLDELPQFVAVLKGEMSFIGPRPERPFYTEQYIRKISGYESRTQFVKPGITGLAQVLNGYDDDLQSVRRKTRLDMRYGAAAKSLSQFLKMEFFIYFKTVGYLLSPIALNARTTLSPVSNTQASVSTAGGTVRKSVGRREAIPNLLTVDLECWFHAYNLSSQIAPCQWAQQKTRVVSNVERLLQLFDRHQAKATFFVLGWVAERFPEVVKMVDAAGHEIGTHGYQHNLVTEMTPEQFETDLHRSLEVLSRFTRQTIRGHRASNFTVTKDSLWALDRIKKAGLEYDSSIFPVRRKRYGIPDYPNGDPHRVSLGTGRQILEFPLSTLTLVRKRMPIAGGGYLRLAPGAFTEWFIAHRNAQRLPAMVYLHPWEIDTEQPRLKVNPIHAFQHYVNIDRLEERLGRLLSRFAFTSIGASLATDSMQDILRNNPVTIDPSRLIQERRSNPFEPSPRVVYGREVALQA